MTAECCCCGAPVDVTAAERGGIAETVEADVATGVVDDDVDDEVDDMTTDESGWTEAAATEVAETIGVAECCDCGASFCCCGAGATAVLPNGGVV